MAITALPTPPSRSDPANFAARGDALLGALPTLVTEINAATAEVDSDRVAAAASASAALASQNAAATSAGNANSAAGSSAASAAAALAAAAATQAGLPAQTSTNGKVLRSERGVATWGNSIRTATLVEYSSAINQIPNSSALNYASWLLGANVSTIGFQQTYPGPLGLRSCIVVMSATPGNAYVGFQHTPVQGVTKTASVWWKGSSKPASGALLAADYLDASNVLQRAHLHFSDPGIIADGQWRRYGLTWTHAGSDVSPRYLYVVLDPPVGSGVEFSDPQIEVGGSASENVVTGPSHLSEPGCNFNVDTTNGPVTVFLPADFDGGDTIGFKDVGRACATNPLTLERNTTLIESLAENLVIDVNGASVFMHFAQRKGWLIK